VIGIVKTAKPIIFLEEGAASNVTHLKMVLVNEVLVVLVNEVLVNEEDQPAGTQRKIRVIGTVQVANA